ncbi:DUF7199 family protein [Mycolicibacterium houstonense]|uniref:DUF7199 family protein n=1 Tax=Mycolicibacterium houstonense TaxID=146021 RepID=UPI003F4979DC
MRVRDWLVLLASCAGLWLSGVACGLGLAVEAQAAPTCEHRSAEHVAAHGGLTADSAWHVSHGGLPTCGAEEGSTPAPTPVVVPEDEEEDESKSRFCRRKWYC